MRPTQETYDEWQLAYQVFNQVLFDEQLPDCLITLQREKNTMGYFSKARFANRAGEKTDEIALNPAYFAVSGMREALQTLGHEMVHLWQHHYGEPGRGRYHNAEWADKMESIGLMPSSTGRPDGKRTGDRMADYIIEGGVFEHAITAVKKAGFELKWMDRFIAMPGCRQQAMLPDMEATLSASLTQMPEAAIRHGLAEAFGMDTQLADTLDIKISRLTQNKQGNRSKYTCPECDTNLWGRPGLNIQCGDCQIAFDEH